MSKKIFESFSIIKEKLIQSAILISFSSILIFVYVAFSINRFVEGQYIQAAIDSLVSLSLVYISISNTSSLFDSIKEIFFQNIVIYHEDFEEGDIDVWEPTDDTERKAEDG